MMKRAMNNKELSMCVCVSAYVHMGIHVCAYAYVRIRCVCDGRLSLRGIVSYSYQLKIRGHHLSQPFASQVLVNILVLSCMWWKDVSN